MSKDVENFVGAVWPGLEDGLCFSSIAIDGFARALEYGGNARDRFAEKEPTLITFDQGIATWPAAVRSLCERTKRLVVAVNEDWLEEYLDGEHGYDRPMAFAYEVIGENYVATEVKLHRSRTGEVRLCSADLTREYVLYRNGTGAWEPLPEAFTKLALFGVQRAGLSWYFDYLEQQAEEVMAGIRQPEEEEHVGASVSLPGVVLNMGRWRRPLASVRAA